MENKDAILKNLESENPQIVAETVQDIKRNGDLDMASSLLDALVKQGKNVAIVANLLADIKDNDFRSILIAQLEKATDVVEKSNLLRISWESSLDYSAYLAFFLNLVLNEEFLVAMEASTAIENMVHLLNEEQQQYLKDTLTKTSLPEEKVFFAENILAELAIIRGE